MLLVYMPSLCQSMLLVCLYTGPAFKTLTGWQCNLGSQLEDALPYEMAAMGIEGRSDRVTEILDLEELAYHELQFLT